MEEQNNEKVFKTHLSVVLYEAYEKFLSIPDFGGHKTIDAMNFLADAAISKGYMIPTPGYYVEQVKCIVASRLANFIRKHSAMNDGVFNPLLLDDDEREEFDKLCHTYDFLEDMLQEVLNGKE